jgi:hypothetical protein
MAARRGIAAFLTIVGVIAIVFGLLYLSAGARLPHLLLGHVHHGHHLRRAEVCLLGGGVCVVAAWLLRGRKQRSLTASRPGYPRLRAARLP